MKAIETFYRGYKFRSRLEARWAVFFDALQIEYRYELEGYDLGGIWYLPDFWLPQHDCWIEIKAEDRIVRKTKPLVQRDTKEEDKKAQLLAWYTQKDVYIVSGDVWKPATAASLLEQILGAGQARVFEKIEVVVEDLASLPLLLPLPSEVAILLFKIHQLGIILSIFLDGGWLFATLEQPVIGFSAAPIHDVVEHIERLNREFPALIEQVEQRVPEILTSFATLPHLEDLKDAPILKVRGGRGQAGYQWMVCKRCKRGPNIFTPHFPR